MAEKSREEIEAEVKALFDYDREGTIAFGQAWLKALLTPTKGDNNKD